MHGNTKIFGYVNCAYFNRTQGDRRWFATEEARDQALEALRESAAAAGLSGSACQSSIYPVTSRVGALSDDRRQELEAHGRTHPFGP